MTHRPHVHMIVPGGGIFLDGERWVASRSSFFLPVRVLSRLFRRLFLERLLAAHHQLNFFGGHAALAHPRAFAAYLAPLQRRTAMLIERIKRVPAARRRTDSYLDGRDSLFYFYRSVLAGATMRSAESMRYSK